MKKILIVNGPNLNLLGYRNPILYGKTTYEELCEKLYDYAKEKKVELDIFQSNSEGALIDELQRAFFASYDGLILNFGGYSHTSIALRDAVEIIKCPVVEVHLSDLSAREEYRRHTLIEDLASARFIGEGIKGYFKAVDFLLNL